MLTCKMPWPNSKVIGIIIILVKHDGKYNLPSAKTAVESQD